MRARKNIEADIPKRISIDDHWDLEGLRNQQILLTLILEVLLDMREMVEGKKDNGS